MKDITKESIKQDFNTIHTMLRKYNEAIYESQEGQPAHYDNQSKLCRLLISDIRCGLVVTRDALSYLSGIDIIED